MKIVKPLRLGFLSRVVLHERRPNLTVTLLLCFPFESPRRFLYEASLWTIAAGELGKDAVLDEGYAKPRGEVLVTGSCFVPGGVSRPSSSVRVQIGSVDKTLHVAGDRSWETLGMSDPEPFVEMPIAYGHAFGGEGYAPNPLGKGVAPVRLDGKAVHPLPNVEDPKHLIKAPGDRPEPAGLDGYPLTWPQRSSKLGTHDDAWLEHGFPGFARDLDPSFFNTAPADQQIDGYFHGDEAFVLEHMHPDAPRLEGALPGVITRCFVNQRTEEGETFREAEMRLDTVRFFPRRERGLLVYRGVFEIGEDDADDVLHLVAACEALGEPRPVEHYRAVLAKRLDRKAERDVAREDDELMPWPADPGAKPLPDDMLSGVAALLKRDDYHARHTARQRAQEGAETSAGLPPDVAAELAAAGIDPTPYLRVAPEEPPPTELVQAALHEEEEESPEVRAAVAQAKESLRAQGVDPERFFAEPAGMPDALDEEQALAEAEEKVRAAAQAQGFDYDALMEHGRAQANADPLVLEKQIQALQDIIAKADADAPELDEMLADPELLREVTQQEAPPVDAPPAPEAAPREAIDDAQREAYALFAHTFPAASRLDGDAATRLRDEVLAGRREGRSFARCDLTGADLSGLDLQGIDLQGAMLESAVLANADLRGANLEGAILAHADLTGSDLRGARLGGANLGAAILRDAKAGGVDLRDAVLVKADLSGADLTGARLSTADLSEAIFTGADLSGVTGTKITFFKVDLSSATLRGADLQRCTFLESKVSGVDFGGANLSATSFVGSQGDGAIFRSATLAGLSVVRGSSFVDADFRGAMLEGANLMGTRLSRSDFSDANLRGAVLSECDLSGATLDRAVLVDATLVRANLSGASLFAVDLMASLMQKANVRGADLELSNLFGADATRMTGDEVTRFRGANLKRACFAEARRPDGEG
jgi:uncharacterized protein YjbI with pentapeptide repeats